MPKLPKNILERRLDNEEKDLKSRGYSFQAEGVWKDMIIGSIAGTETLPVARKYEVEVFAKGFVRVPKEAEPKELPKHKTRLYILEAYPYPTDKSDVGAPVRIVWLTSIFHPNISPGMEAKGKGIVCWGIMKEWTNLDTLYGIVKGLELLIEHPNVKSPLNIPECLDAAKWFANRPSSA